MYLLSGLSGLDASIGFESTRAENEGFVFNDINFIDQTIKGVSLLRLHLHTSILIRIVQSVLECPYIHCGFHCARNHGSCSLM